MQFQKQFVSFTHSIVLCIHHVAEAKTGVFKPARPFSSLKSVTSNAAIFGTIMGVQRLSSKSLELARARDDVYNDIFGFVVTYKYYTTILGHADHRRLLVHNRILGLGIGSILLYATLLA